MNRILCEDRSLPPNMMEFAPTTPTRRSSTRQRTEELTERPGTSCEGCHRTLNPPGFALEAFDGLGRSRRVERVFDDDGTLLAEHGIDLRDTWVLGDGNRISLEGPKDLARFIADEPRAMACFARQLARFTLGRPEDLTRDGCLLAEIYTGLQEDLPLVEIVAQTLASPSFTRVNKEDPGQ
ncbi:MAG: DUF1588 domain-containing protein [Myxococcales bacterium]|nr:DUF1588 domain-containing protein [Myxococcales bacterium]